MHLYLCAASGSEVHPRCLNSIVQLSSSLRLGVASVCSLTSRLNTSEILGNLLQIRATTTRNRLLNGQTPKLSTLLNGTGKEKRAAE